MGSKLINAVRTSRRAVDGESRAWLQSSRDIFDSSPGSFTITIAGRSPRAVTRMCVYKPIIQSSLLVVFLPAVALRQFDQAAFARRVDRAVLVAGREVDEDRVDVADVAWAADVVPQRAQLGDLGLVEPGLARDRVAGRGHRDARRVDRLLDRHAVIDQVDEHVVDRADDGRAARRAEGGHRLASLEEDRRRHARARALAALDVVRAGPAEARVHVEAED